MKLINDDCMNILPKYEDNYFDLAIVDPPYGIKRFGDRVETTNRLERTLREKPKKIKINEWDVKPSPEYFKELFRVSKNQIIWGANNFTLPNTEYFIVWDKQQTVDNFASAEYAWTNIKKPAKVFRHSIHKVMVSRKQEKGKIHPTQKPVALYRWLLENYAEPTDMILDTHLGSGSSAIACHYFGTQVFVGIEIDKEYFDMASERIAKETRQLKLL